MIYNSLKFDLRIYVLVAGSNPLRIYLYKDGLVRFATEKYERANSFNKKNRYKHLTNYAINKNNSKFFVAGEEEGFEEENSRDGDEQDGEDLVGEERAKNCRKDDKGHKRSIVEFFCELSSQGFGMESVWKEIKKICVKTMLSIQPILKHSYNVAHTDDPYNQICFELLGLDILLDSCLRPYLLEVNHAPSFSCDSRLDYRVKSKLIEDTFRMLNLTKNERLRLMDLKSNQMKQMTLKGRRNHLAQGDFLKRCLEDREEYIDSVNGDYDRIYPPFIPEEEIIYSKLLAQAEINYTEFTGTSNNEYLRKEKPLDKANISNSNLYANANFMNTYDQLEEIYGNKLKENSLLRQNKIRKVSTSNNRLFLKRNIETSQNKKKHIRQSVENNTIDDVPDKETSLIVGKLPKGSVSPKPSTSLRASNAYRFIQKLGGDVRITSSVKPSKEDRKKTSMFESELTSNANREITQQNPNQTATSKLLNNNSKLADFGLLNEMKFEKVYASGQLMVNAGPVVAPRKSPYDISPFGAQPIRLPNRLIGSDKPKTSTPKQST